MAEIIIKCKTCKEKKPLAAYGECSDCFSSNERHKASEDMELDADGCPLCRFCKRRVIPPRRTFCSENCVHEWSMRSNVQYARAQVFLRDHGVCAVCGIDTVALADEMIKLRTENEEEWKRQWEILVEQDWDPTRHMTMWDNDHIKPVVEGGGLCGLENYRTLCIPHHREATRELRTRMAAQNKEDKRTK